MEAMLIEARPRPRVDPAAALRAVFFLGATATVGFGWPALQAGLRHGSPIFAGSVLAFCVVVSVVSTLALPASWLARPWSVADPLVGTLGELGASEVHAVGRAVTALLQWDGRAVRVTQRSPGRRRKDGIVVEVACDARFVVEAFAPLRPGGSTSVRARADAARAWASDAELLAMVGAVLPAASGATLRLEGARLRWALPAGVGLDAGGWRRLLTALVQIAADSEAHRAKPAAPVRPFLSVSPSPVVRVFAAAVQVVRTLFLVTLMWATVVVVIVEFHPLIFG